MDTGDEYDSTAFIGENQEQTRPDCADSVNPKTVVVFVSFCDNVHCPRWKVIAWHECISWRPKQLFNIRVIHARPKLLPVFHKLPIRWCKQNIRDKHQHSQRDE